MGRTFDDTYRSEKEADIVRDLIGSSARAEELIDIDELERFAEEGRARRGGKNGGSDQR